jgi:hypothetical protein
MVSNTMTNIDTATTRQDIESSVNEYGVASLPSGFGNNTETTVFVPSCQIEDVDRAVVKLFETDIGFSTEKTFNGHNGPIQFKRPTVIYATGERFAMVKKQKPIRDVNGTLILPSISIRRTSITQGTDSSMARGMNQSTGNITIKHKINDSDDVNLQRLLNKSGFKNIDFGALSSTGDNAEDSNSLQVASGMLLDPSLVKRNSFLFITLPQPRFYTATYEIIFWTLYTEHMNYMIETLLSSQLPQGKNFKLNTDKGYWFLAAVGDDFSSQGNIDEFTDKERILKYSFSLTVPAYVFATSGPGQRVPIQVFSSFKGVSLDFVDGIGELKHHVESHRNTAESKFALTDGDSSGNDTVVPLPKSTESLFVYKKTIKLPNGSFKTHYVKASTNARGETTFNSTHPLVLEEFYATLGR